MQLQHDKLATVLLLLSTPTVDQDKQYACAVDNAAAAAAATVYTCWCRMMQRPSGYQAHLMYRFMHRPLQAATTLNNYSEQVMLSWLASIRKLLSVGTLGVKVEGYNTAVCEPCMFDVYV
jgi:hypothetical protein